ncbi:MAG: hypothetical protein LBD48_13145 [Treponema sp.]|jgi:hypothetical protein|nr:hypothetical protein [Treponema sp.]
MADLKEISLFSKIILFVILLYLAGSVVLLLLWVGVLPYQRAEHPYALMGFAIISCILTLLISSYHLFLMLVRRKRKLDMLPNS